VKTICYEIELVMKVKMLIKKYLTIFCVQNKGFKGVQNKRNKVCVTVGSFKETVDRISMDSCPIQD